MRVEVLADVCQGHGVCFMSSPELFELGEDDGHAHVSALVVDGAVPTDLEAKASLGAMSCPEKAIRIY